MVGKVHFLNVPWIRMAVGILGGLASSLTAAYGMRFFAGGTILHDPIATSLIGIAVMPGIAYVAFVVWPLVGGAPAIGGALLANIANAIGGQVLFFSGVFLGSRFQVLNAFYNLFLGVTLATGVGSFAMALLYYRLGKLTFREAALHFLVGTATGYFFMMHGGGKAVGGAYSLIKWFEFFGLWQVPMALMTAVQITDRESFP